MTTERKKIIRSPLFYVGDKYRLMEQLLSRFPTKINNFYEPFVGGGTVFLNVQAKGYFLNDINKKLVGIHRFLMKSAKKPAIFFAQVDEVIAHYKFSRSYQEDIIPATLKARFVKTYYARFNKRGYEKLRADINAKKVNDPLALYLLLIYGFNRMLRFNREGEFNLPVGNVDFNKNVERALRDYFSFVVGKHIKFSAKEFKEFTLSNRYEKDDFIYLDPPYLLADSEYNKLWGERFELELFDLLDEVNQSGVKFCLSNVTHYNGKTNDFLIKWMRKYRVDNVQSNYINYHNNSRKKMKEVLISNY